MIRVRTIILKLQQNRVRSLLNLDQPIQRTIIGDF
jgi:hypothetical protein